MRAILPPPFEWIDILTGKVKLEKGGYLKKSKTFTVEAFAIAKYPVTNVQYRVFVDARDGYRQTKWWDYSDNAKKWRAENPQPKDTGFPGGDHPRTRVNWYDSVAFCRWLTAQINGFVSPSPAAQVGTQDLASVSSAPPQIMLPTEQQWQRAAQGDDNLIYPWGDKFDKSLCNMKESGIGQTTPVTQYPGGASPYGVMDMSGNVWEWCLTEWASGSIDLQNDNSRVMRGGSWVNSVHYARAAYRLTLTPDVWHLNRGFRLVVAPINSL